MVAPPSMAPGSTLELATVAYSRTVVRGSCPTKVNSPSNGSSRPSRSSCTVVSSTASNSTANLDKTSILNSPSKVYRTISYDLSSHSEHATFISTRQTLFNRILAVPKDHPQIMALRRPVSAQISAGGFQYVIIEEG
jgi:hypothetical protein